MAELAQLPPNPGAGKQLQSIKATGWMVQQYLLPCSYKMGPQPSQKWSYNSEKWLEMNG